MGTKTPHCHPDRPYYAKGLCRSCYERQLRQVNPDYARAQRKNNEQWRKKFPDRKAEQDAAYQADPRNRDRKSLNERARVLAAFGLSLDDEKQAIANGCAICGGLPGGRWYHLDHDHETGRARGFLCGRCNKGLGLLGDNIEGLERALAYLKSPPLQASQVQANLFTFDPELHLERSNGTDER
jgi:hypothetical protein